MPNNAFSILSLFYNIFVFITFFTKERLNTLENKIYKYLIVFNSLNIVSVLICWFTILLRDYIPIINDFISKLVLVFYAGWVLLFTLYVFLISYKDKKEKFINIYKKAKKIMIALFIIITLLIYILPLNYYGIGNVAYSFGPSANVVYITTTVCMILWIIMCLTNLKKLKNKKYLPVLIFVVFILIATLIQKINPAILLTTAVESFVTVIMFFTIENPDMKMLNEITKNNELVEQTYIDKSNFLFEMTGEVRDPLFNIRRIYENLEKEEDINNIKNGLKTINNSLRQLDFIVNDVLNVSTLDVQKVKFVNSRYNLKNLYDDLIIRIRPIINNDVEFRTIMPNKVPYLYGDYIKLKQVLYSLLMNSIKKTDRGFIEFNIDIIERYDVCRVIFRIIDSGSGISIDKINEILSVTGEFDKNDIEDLEKSEFNIKLCQKIIKSLGGNLLLKSKKDKGTEIILTIDQKVHVENTGNILNSYSFETSSNKKVLVVSQDKNLNNIIKKKFSDHDISASFILYGLDAVDKIKSGKKYDFIIVEDDMKEMNGYTTLTELKKLDKFNIPVIIMLKDNKLSIKEEYIKDGFKDYILLNNISVELDRIIDKY